MKEEKKRDRTLQSVLIEYLKQSGVGYRMVAREIGLSATTLNTLRLHGEYSQHTARLLEVNYGGAFSGFAIAKKCKDCGDDFYPKRRDHIRCQECAVNHQKSKNIYKTRGHPASIPVVKVKEKCKSVVVVNQEARDIGLSYGQYMASKRVMS